MAKLKFELPIWMNSAFINSVSQNYHDGVILVFLVIDVVTENDR